MKILLKIIYLIILINICSWGLHVELCIRSKFNDYVHFFSLFGWLVVFNVPSTARSFRDGTPIYCPLRRTWSSINTPFRPGIETRAVARQSITLPLRYASSTSIFFFFFQKHNAQCHTQFLFIEITVFDIFASFSKRYCHLFQYCMGYILNYFVLLLYFYSNLIIENVIDDGSIIAFRF